MSNNNPQEGSQVNNNNNSPMTTAKEYYWMAATVQRLEVVAAAPQHMCPGESHFQEFSEAIWEEGVNQTLKGVFNTDVLSFSLDDNSNLPGKDKAKSVVTLLQTTISKDLQTISRSASTDVTLSSWTSIFTELKQLKVSISELYGLLFQNVLVAPVGINKKTFEFTIVKPSTSYTSMDLDAMQAFCQSQGKYVHPNQQNPPAQQGPPPAQSRQPNRSLKKASFYRGQLSPSEALKEKYEVFHNADSTYRPPPCPTQQQGRLRQLDGPDASDGKFLLDSGALTHIQGYGQDTDKQQND
ncbi:hypothetical protein MJO28_000839 [Puccinia striiformis f. sp. tritici]|uniref:Uncharacterized protein n=1 Tax=Puccinia striiformis f. sp. tritici TaxID=168172 RepID=A0ACC0EYL1_9BASI|nr:hypothetical protein MJO28_000839 [Puccinia striiformis f. sp. tritici]